MSPKNRRTRCAPDECLTPGKARQGKPVKGKRASASPYWLIRLWRDGEALVSLRPVQVRSREVRKLLAYHGFTWVGALDGYDYYRASVNGRSFANLDSICRSAGLSGENGPFRSDGSEVFWSAGSGPVKPGLKGRLQRAKEREALPWKDEQWKRLLDIVTGKYVLNGKAYPLLAKIDLCEYPYTPENWHGRYSDLMRTLKRFPDFGRLYGLINHLCFQASAQNDWTQERQWDSKRAILLRFAARQLDRLETVDPKKDNDGFRKEHAERIRAQLTIPSFGLPEKEPKSRQTESSQAIVDSVRAQTGFCLQALLPESAIPALHDSAWLESVRAVESMDAHYIRPIDPMALSVGQMRWFV